LLLPERTSDAIFRAVSNANIIGGQRLLASSVSRIMKTLAADLVVHRDGKDMEAARADARKYSGHSLHSGYATSAAAARIPVLTIANQTRHRSLEVLQGYVRSVDRWDEGSGLRGIQRKRTA
jgi:integrase